MLKHKIEIFLKKASNDMLYNFKLLWQLNSIKSSRAHSRANWLQEERDRDGSQNVGFFLQPVDVAVCLRRFY
jgi:hypothetical protein